MKFSWARKFQNDVNQQFDRQEIAFQGIVGGVLFFRTFSIAILRQMNRLGFFSQCWPKEIVTAILHGRLKNPAQVL